MTERVYQLTRIAAGDYLLPSNDGSRLWRLYRYWEDGSLLEGDPWGEDARPIVGWFWAACRFDGTLEDAERLLQRDPDEFLDWSHWSSWASVLPTRREAEQAALAACVRAAS